MACARPHIPDAMAMAKPEVIATQLVPPVAAVVWAKIGLANTNSTSANNINFVLI